MGLIKAAVGAIGSTLGDQWQDLIKCEDMGSDTLMVKKTTPSGQISKGSNIIVAPGQVAVIYDSGAVVDATAEEGTYTFDASSSPSFFGGQFGAVFKEMWQRFTYNGTTAKEQVVFFFNIKEIINNKFGTPAPIPFQDWSHAIPNRMTNTISPMSVKIRCYGTYTFKMYNPAIFMSELAGTVDIYFKKNVEEQMRSEVLAAFQNILNELGNSNHKVPVLEMPSQTDEIKEMMDKAVYDEAIRRRGLRLVSFSVESVTLDDESEDKINNYEFSSNTYMQQGRMTEAYANAIENAAKNTAGVGNGFMGIGIANMSTGGMMGANNTNVMQDFNAQSSTQTYDPYATQQPAATQPPVQGTVTQSEPTQETDIQQPQIQEPAVQQSFTEQQPIQEPTIQQVQQAPVQPVTMQEESVAPKIEQPIQENTPVQNKEPIQQETIQQETTQFTPVQEQVQSNNNSASNVNGNVKVCMRCGNINTADSLFCNKCGNQL